MNTSLWIARMPGHCATISSIHIWKMSWLILSPNGTRRKRYLPRCVLNIVSSDALSVRCIPKNALLPSTFENLVALVSMCAISPRVGTLWCSRMIALFRSFRSRQILNLPLVFLGMSASLPMVSVLSVSLWYLGGPSRSALFDLRFVLDWHLASSMLYWWYARVGFDVIFTWHVTYLIKRVRIQGLQVPGAINLNATWLHIDWVELWHLYWGLCWLFFWSLP